MLMEYQIKCKEGELAFFNLTDMDLQGKDCFDDMKNPKYVRMYIFSGKFC